MKIYEIIQEEMKAQNITAANISKATNISASHLSSFFAGKKQLSLNKVDEIFEYLNITPNIKPFEIEESRFEESSFKYYLNELIVSGRLTNTQIKCVQRVIGTSYRQLPQKEKESFKYIVSANYVQYCDICANEISWDSMIFALEHKNCCRDCFNIFSRLKKEIKNLKK